jgi:hypothetical protein
LGNANHWNGAIYTDEFAAINPILTVFLNVCEKAVHEEIAKRCFGLYPEPGEGRLGRLSY